MHVLLHRLVDPAVLLRGAAAGLAVPVIAVVTLTAWPCPAAAADRSGVRPEVLSVPSGPGSIEGLGEGFEPSLQSGTASFGIPIRVPPGVAGQAPALRLSYSTGTGNGELGLGWSLAMPSVQRGTDRRLPAYDATDVFVLRGAGGGGAEELVRMADGSYRFRIEGAFARGFQRSDGTWEFQSRAGETSLFGQAQARIENGSRVFSWLLTRQTDGYGNPIRYEYERDATARPYLTRIVYNDFSPEVRNEVVLVYEDRPDVLTSHLSTFRVTTARRLARLDVKHGGELVFTYTLRYDMMEGLSRLVQVTLAAADGTALPSFTMGYAEPQLSAAGLVTMTSAPARALGPTTELDDVDGDALADLLIADPSVDGGRYSYVPNLDGRAFGLRQVLTTSPSVWLTSAGVQLADMDGDGAADVVAKLSPAADGLRYFPSAGTGAAGFGDGVVITPNPSFSLEDADVRLLDLDHDRLTDWLRIDPSTGGMFVAFNQGGGRFTAEASLGRRSPTEVLSFSSGLRLADMNGDGLSDLVAARSGSLRFFAAMGRGRFDPAVTAAGAPTLSMTELAELEIRDVSGDGLADLVHVGTSQVRIWRNQAGMRLATPIVIEGTPARRPETTVRVADMNGNGSADIVWVTLTSTAAAWQYLDLLGDGAPGLLIRLDNGLGKITMIGYAGLGEMRAWARAEGIPWTRRSSVGQMVVSEIAVEDGLGYRGVTQLRYADAYFDSALREFRGFGKTRRIEVGDVEQPTLLTDSEFDVGDSDEARKGLVLHRTRRTEAGSVFDETLTTYTVRDVSFAADETPLRYAFASQEDRSILEGQTAPRLLRTEWDRDQNGNLILEVNHGEIGAGGDVAVGDDERRTERTYAAPMNGSWVLDRVAVERVVGGDGGLLAETRTMYDGEAFVGLPLRQVERGAPTRVETWIESDRFAMKEALERDAFGNVIRRRDGRDGLSTMTYADDQTLLTRIDVQATSAGPLTWRVDFDPRLGVMTRLVGPDGQESRFAHDGLGRLRAIVEPGDSDELPTQAFEYALQAPISNVRIETREQSGEPGGIVEYRHVDGLGRSRGIFQEAPGQMWRARDLATFGARGWPRFLQHPRFEGSADPVPPDEAKGGLWTTYDPLGREREEREADGARRRWDYPPLAVVASDEDDLDPASPHFGSPTTRHKDGLDRVRRLVELDSGREVVTRYDHDALGNLIAVTDPRGVVRRYEWDGRSRQTAVVEPNSGRWIFSYDDRDRLLARQDPLGNRVAWSYDFLGRLIDERQQTPGAPEQTTVLYHHDEPSGEHPDLAFVAGRLAWIEDEVGAVFFGYDRRGRSTARIRRWKDGTEHATWTEHDAASRVTRRGFPDGSYLPFDYDEAGLLHKAGGLLRQATWTADSRLDCATFGNDVKDCRAYDARLRLSGMKATGPAGSLLRDLTITRDPASHIRSILDGRSGVDPLFDLSADFEHDDRVRLLRAADRVAETTWQLDDIGNLQSVTSGHAEPALNAGFEYGEDGAGPDQLTSAGSETLGYDAAGRLVQDGERTLDWDAKGRLRRVTRGDTVEDYAYDFADARAVKTTRRGDGAPEVVLTIDADTEERAGELLRYFFFDGVRAVTLPAEAERGSMRAAASRNPPGQVSGPTKRSPARTGLVALLLLALSGIAAILLGRWRPAGLRSTASRVALRLWPACLLVLTTCGGGAPAPIAHGGVPIDTWPAAATLELSDYQASVVASVDAAGELAAERAYHPYGLLRTARGAALPHLFVGNERDQAVGLDDFRARTYRSSVARFLSVDPVVLQPADAAQAGHAAYAYTAGNPIDFSDPDGREKGMLPSSFANDTCVGKGGCSHQEWEAYRDAAHIEGDPHPFLDAVGTVDPTGIADGINGAIYAAEGDLGNAAISAAAILPFGDLAKLRRAKKAIDAIDEASDIGQAASRSSRAARREAMRQTAIPTSQQPRAQSRNASGRSFEYEVSRPGGGTETRSVQQQTLDRSHLGQGHWEAGRVKTDPLTGEVRLNDYGRPKLTNDKSKVDYQ